MKDLLLRLLTHEVQIALSSKCMSNEPNHFMKLYSTINNWSKRREHTHVCIHLCIHQSKCQCLITNKCLQQFKKKKGRKHLNVLEVFLIFFFFLKQAFCIIRVILEILPRTQLDVHNVVPCQQRKHPATTDDHQVTMTLASHSSNFLLCDL